MLMDFGMIAKVFCFPAARTPVGRASEQTATLARRNNLYFRIIDSCGGSLHGSPMRMPARIATRSVAGRALVSHAGYGLLENAARLSKRLELRAHLSTTRCKLFLGKLGARELSTERGARSSGVLEQWSSGVMEWWSDVLFVSRIKLLSNNSDTPVLQYSNTPLLRAPCSITPASSSTTPFLRRNLVESRAKSSITRFSIRDELRSGG